MVMRRLKTGCSAHLVPGVGDAPGLIWPGEEQALLTNQLVWRDAELGGLNQRCREILCFLYLLNRDREKLHAGHKHISMFQVGRQKVTERQTEGIMKCK